MTRNYNRSLEGYAIVHRMKAMEETSSCDNCYFCEESCIHPLRVGKPRMSNFCAFWKKREGDNS